MFHPWLLFVAITALHARNAYAATLPSQWEGPFQLPLVSVMAANLPSGDVLAWAAFLSTDNTGGGQTVTAKFDSTTGLSTSALIKDTKHDMYCPGTAQLGDGRIMISGGFDNRATTYYDPATDTWSIGPQLVIARGYHAMTVLTDGSVFTMGGSWSGGLGNKTGEVWDVNTEVWSIKANLLQDALLTSDPGGVFRSDNHMWFQLAPNGKLFHAGPSKQMHWLDVTGDGTITPSILRGDDTDAMNGNAIMYDIGKILKVGGSPSYEASFGSHAAYVIDINGDEAVVERVGDLSFNRTFSNSVVLPSGEVVVIGGMVWAIVFSDEGAVLQAEIWNPTTKTFSLLAPMKVVRNYHSVALLLKDGRVMSSGGGLCGSCAANHLDAEILTPPYLLNADGSPATRPVILSNPDTIIPGGTITVTMDTTGPHSFALVRLSVTTHAVNNDLRRIPLQVVGSNNGVFTLAVPSNLNVVIPGSYYLFAMNSNGVPSTAVVVIRPLRLQETTANPTSAPTSSPTTAPTTKPTLSPTNAATNQPTGTPTKPPTNSPTPSPTKTPTTKPTSSPTNAATNKPTGTPTKPPTNGPTRKPTSLPTKPPTTKPTLLPTIAPTNKPTVAPTTPPTNSPTRKPTTLPTKPPTTKPTLLPTIAPTNKPTAAPTTPPTNSPTRKPTLLPTKTPTTKPTLLPTIAPTNKPTATPTKPPTNAPTRKPTSLPTKSPTTKPTLFPTNKPTGVPTKPPTNSPTLKPTSLPTNSPTTKPSLFPTIAATNQPAVNPTRPPTNSPTRKPTSLPTKTPTTKPTLFPTNVATNQPTAAPTKPPTQSPTRKPTSSPTKAPTTKPTLSPISVATNKPTATPTTPPTNSPTRKPTSLPTKTPTTKPTLSPTIAATNRPTVTPTKLPTNSPTRKPTPLPTKTPTTKPTLSPTNKPTGLPTKPPTNSPTRKPTSLPTKTPTNKPTVAPISAATTNQPIGTPIKQPTSSPTHRPTFSPTKRPTTKPIIAATSKPTQIATKLPTTPPSSEPSLWPSNEPTSQPEPSHTVGYISSFTLVDASTSQPLHTLTDKAVLRLSSFKYVRRVNILAETVGCVNSVEFQFLGAVHTSNTRPFIFEAGWIPAIGSYSLKGTPFLLEDKEGTAGSLRHLTFKVIA